MAQFKVGNLSDGSLILPGKGTVAIPPNPLITSMQDNLASKFHKHLLEWINNFDADLDDAHEVGIRLVSFGQTITFHLEDIGYQNPSLICFYGRLEDGNPVELIQHVTQISVLLMKMTRKDTRKPKRKIGFAAPAE